MRAEPRISVIVPVRNEQLRIAELGPWLRALESRGHQVILVDGGSRDDSLREAERQGLTLIQTAAGRALQMNAGAERAQAPLLWFLHIDSEVPEAALRTLERLGQTQTQPFWGRFDVSLSGRQTAFRVIEWCMNQRSRWTGIATGDQGIFVHRILWQQVQGYAPIALMEDIQLSHRLKRLAPPQCLRVRLQTSSRRWEQRGIGRTVLLMWTLRLLYCVGVSPARLARWYR